MREAEGDQQGLGLFAVEVRARERVVSIAQVGNNASRRIMAKLGMRYEWSTFLRFVRRDIVRLAHRDTPRDAAPRPRAGVTGCAHDPL